MVGQIVDIMRAVFGQCLVWFQTLIDSVGGTYYILSAFAMVVICGLIVYPIRGAGIRVVGGMDFTKTEINKARAESRRKQAELDKKYGWRRV